MSMGRHPFREPHIVANSERKVALSRYCTLRYVQDEAPTNHPPSFSLLSSSLPQLSLVISPIRTCHPGFIPWLPYSARLSNNCFAKYQSYAWGVSATPCELVCFLSIERHAGAAISKTQLPASRAGQGCIKLFTWR